MNLLGLVNYMAARVLISDRGHKNSYVYRDSKGSGEWMPLIWDIDLNWGRNWTPGPAYFDDTLTQNNSLEPYPGNAFHNLIYEIPELSDMYLRRLRSEVFPQSRDESDCWQEPLCHPRLCGAAVGSGRNDHAS